MRTVQLCDKCLNTFNRTFATMYIIGFKMSNKNNSIQGISSLWETVYTEE